MSETQSTKIDPTRAQIELYTGVGKKSGKPFESLRVVIGEFSTLVFPTAFEMKYIKEYIKPAPTPQEVIDAEKGFLD